MKLHMSDLLRLEPAGCLGRCLLLMVCSVIHTTANLEFIGRNKIKKEGGEQKMERKRASSAQQQHYMVTNALYNSFYVGITSCITVIILSYLQ